MVNPFGSCNVKFKNQAKVKRLNMLVLFTKLQEQAGTKILFRLLWDILNNDAKCAYTGFVVVAVNYKNFVREK